MLVFFPSDFLNVLSRNVNENKAIKQNKIDENIHTCFSTQLD